MRGLELNVFIDGWGKPEGKVDKNLFFHLLIGLDPDGKQPPEYWATHIYKECDDTTEIAAARTNSWCIGTN